jgi:hypothetical protein
MKNLLAIGVFTLVGAALAPGQTGLATVTGTVTDSSGAAILNAPVQLTNLGIGQVLTAATSDTGNFTISQVPVGDYDLLITAPGFKTYTRKGFHLSAQQTMREDVALQVGSTSEAVTVTADASLLKTETSELVHNVTLAQLNNLPILPVASNPTGFRDPFQSVRLIPGIQYTNGVGQTMVVNGNPSSTVQLRLDGATAGRTNGSVNISMTQQTQPSVDAIEEVAVLTSNYAAEFGTAGGAVINMVSKSGTNDFHGSAYDYALNEVLNAHQPYTGARNKIRRHDWGFSIGGPVIVPKLYDGTNRTFFFWNFEQYRENNIITNSTATVPTQAYRNGDFTNLINQENRLLRTATGNYTDPLNRTIASGTIFDPQTEQALPSGALVRDPFPGNRIPVNLYDPIAVKVLALVPLPAGPLAARQAGTNYQVPWKASRRSSIPSIKVDQVIGQKGRASFYLHETRSSTPRSVVGSDGLTDPISATYGSFTYGTTARLNYDYTATSRLLLHFGISWNDVDFYLVSPNDGYDPAKSLGLRGQTAPFLFPRIIVGSQSTALGGLTNLGPLSRSKVYERRPAGNITATYVMGGHTFKAGAEYRLEKFPNLDWSNTAGIYTFGGNWTQQTSLQGVAIAQGFTGFNFASFLLGGLSGAQMNAPLAASTSKSQTALYVQDNWKLTRKLTLDMGVRWDYGTYAREQYGRYSSFSREVANPSAGGRLGARAYESICQCNFAANYPYAIGPRLGVAYQINDKTVLRGGFGAVYNATSVAAGGSVNTASAGNPAFGGIVGRFQDGLPSEVNAVWPTFDPAAGQAVGAVTGAPTYVDPNAGRPARQLQWSVTLQREINRDLVVEAAYVANRGSWWEAGGLATVNVLSEPALRSLGFNDFTSATEALLLTRQLGQLTAAQQTTLAARGIRLPYAGFPTNQTVRQSLLPFPQYTGSISPAGAPLGNTWYDAFQLTLNKRFSRGLTLNLNYTHSKSLDLMSSPDVFNRQLGKDLSGSDLPHLLRISGEYRLPSLQNSGLPIVSNKVVSYALADWGLGFYLNYQSAPILGRPGSTGTTPISQFLGRGPGPAQYVEGQPFYTTNWVDYDGNQHTDELDINCHCFDPTKTVVLNPAAWSNIPDGQWGAQQTAIRQFRGIRQPTENVNFSRNFRIKERVVLNVRVEFANIFNRLRLPQPALGNFQNQQTKYTTGTNTGLFSGGFGTIVPFNGAGGGTQDMRSGTFVGRLTF